MRLELLNYINNTILSEASKIKYTVNSLVPNDETSLINSTSLVIWSGNSDNTIFQDASVNWAFRALHDTLHLKTRLGFSPLEEIELGKIQASKYQGILADLIYSQVTEQAEYYLKTGNFVNNDLKFTIDSLIKKGYKL